MYRTRRVWPAAVVLLAVAALVLGGLAQAQPVLKPVLQPRLLKPVPRAGLLVNPAILAGALSDLQPLEIFRPEQVVTPDQLPPASIGWPLQLTPVKLQPGRSVRDLSDKPTDGVVSARKFIVKDELLVRPNFELAKVAVAIEGIEAVARGQYNIQFRYTIYDNSIPKPLRFQLNAEGEARPHLCWIPYVHASGGAANVSAHVVAIMMGDTTPLMARADKIGVAVVDGAGNSLGVFTQTVNFTFVKRYRDITRDDIKNYLNTASHVRTGLPVMNPPVSGGGGGAVALPGGQVIKISRAALDWAVGAPGVATRLSGGRSLLGLQEEYCLEPAMVFFRTNQGNYAKALLRAEREGSNPYHVAIWDSRCYAKDQATFNSWPYMSNGAPSNTEYVQLFERGGYLLNTWRFDFDRDGESVVDGREDVFFENPSGPNTQKLTARNGAGIAW